MAPVKPQNRAVKQQSIVASGSIQKSSKLRTVVDFHKLKRFSKSSSQSPTTFMSLPGELRNMIYSYALPIEKNLRLPWNRASPLSSINGRFDMSLLLTSRVFSHEASALLHHQSPLIVHVGQGLVSEALKSNPKESETHFTRVQTAAFRKALRDFQTVILVLHAEDNDYKALAKQLNDVLVQLQSSKAKRARDQTIVIRLDDVQAQEPLMKVLERWLEKSERVKLSFDLPTEQSSPEKYRESVEGADVDIKEVWKELRDRFVERFV